MFLHRVLLQITSAAGLDYYSPNRPGTQYHIPGPKKKNSGEFSKCLNGVEGCIGPIRRPFYLPNQNDYQIILHLRDPRDALTSLFFSLSYSHAGIDESVRNKLISEGIDKFVLWKSQDFLARFQAYNDNFYGNPNVVFVTYEEMIANFETWLRKFSAPFPIRDREELIQQMSAQYKNEFMVSSEVNTNHKRKITPGDHKEKLRPETIEILNQKFGEILCRLGYPPI